MTALSTLLGSRQWSDVPCGAFLPYGGTSAPTGFLMCDGAAVSRTAYSDLFAVMGTVFGVGDGSTTFNVPDLRGRGVIGAGTGTGGGASGTGAPTGGAALTARANGAWVGAETHALSIAELAAHSHNVLAYIAGAGYTTLNAAVGANTNVAGGAVVSTGSGTAHNNVQPVVASNWIVKCVRAFSGSQSFLSRGFIDGLITSNGTDADHDINIAAGACRDSSDAYNMTLASAITKQIDAAWAAGSAAGGLFSGSVGNATWYHVFLIRKDSDGTIDAGFDTSVTAANKPAGYSTYRRIGSVLTNGSANIYAFVQVGDTFYWYAHKYDIGGAVLGTSGSLLALSVPLGISVQVICTIYANKAAESPLIYFSSPYVSDEAPDGATAFVSELTVTTGGGSMTELHGNNLRTNTSSQIRGRSSSASTNAYIHTLGWIDPRGKDA